MAKPQLEDGHTRIANEILEHLMKHHLSPNQWQVLLCIFRKTYGFQKKVDYIANSQIVESTNLCKAVVSRVLRDLEGKGIITRNGKHIGFQKDWERWQELAEQSTTEVSNTANSSKQFSQPELAEQSTKVSSPRVTQKKKETIQKKLYKRKYGEFGNVLLSDLEYQKLKEKFNNRLPVMIESLSEGIASKGYKYQSHYATILSWARRDPQKGGRDATHRGNNKSRRLPTKYRSPEEIYGGEDA